MYSIADDLMTNVGYKYFAENEEVLEEMLKVRRNAWKAVQNVDEETRLWKSTLNRVMQNGCTLFPCEIQYHQAFTVTCLKLKRNIF